MEKKKMQYLGVSRASFTGCYNARLTARLPFQSCPYTTPVWTVGMIAPAVGAAESKNASLRMHYIRGGKKHPLLPVLFITVHLSPPLAARQSPVAPMVLADGKKPAQENRSTWENRENCFISYAKRTKIFGGWADFWIKMWFSLSHLS